MAHQGHANQVGIEDNLWNETAALRLTVERYKGVFRGTCEIGSTKRGENCGGV